MNKIDRLLEDLNKHNKEEDRITKEEVFDKKVTKFKFRDSKMSKLEKKSIKKPDYVLVQYLRSNRTMDFMLSKIISGNIIVVNNKGHELNKRDTFVRNKRYTWYIIKEWDTKPVSTRNKVEGHSTDDHPVLMKMVLGAQLKKEVAQETKKLIVWIVLLAIAGFIGYIFFFAK